MENVRDFALSQARGSFEQSYHTLLNCFCFCGVLFLFLFFSVSESGRRSMSEFYRMAAQQVQPARHTQPPLDCFPDAESPGQSTVQCFSAG